MSRRFALVVLTATAVAVAAAPRAFAAPPRGALDQLDGAAGCLSTDHGHGCGSVRAFVGGGDLAVSPDGEHVYVAGDLSDTVVVLARDRRSGRLVQLRGRAGCVSARRRSGCAIGRALREPTAVAISHDGRNVYVTEDAEGVAVFARDLRSGALKQLPGSAGCLARVARDGCTIVRALRGGRAAVAPDDQNVYVASAAYDSESVVTLARSRQDGALTQLPGGDGCIRRFALDGCRPGRGLSNPAAVAFSPDGVSVYVPSRRGSVAVLLRRAVDGALAQAADPLGCFSVALPVRFCARVRAIQNANDAVVSPDGRHAYVAAGRGVAAFKRDRASGSLTQLPARDGCVSTARSQACHAARGIVSGGANRIVLSPDARTLYVSSTTTSGGGIAVLRRDVASGALRELRGGAGCWEGGQRAGIALDGTQRIRRGPGCSDVRGLDEVETVALSPDGRHAYALSGGLIDNAVAIFAVRRGPARKDPRETPAALSAGENASVPRTSRSRAVSSESSP